MFSYMLTTEIHGRDAGATYHTTLQSTLDAMKEAESCGIDGLIVYLYLDGKIQPRRNAEGKTFGEHTGGTYTEAEYLDWLTGCEK